MSSESGTMIAEAVDIYIEEWRRYRHSCPVVAALDVLGGRWKGAILSHLMQGTKRFSDFRRLMPGLTQRSLTIQLRELERDGVIHRKVYAQVPPKVEYSLTEHGRSLQPILLAMEQWGQCYTDAALCLTPEEKISRPPQKAKVRR